jgi:hypothetical protein
VLACLSRLGRAAPVRSTGDGGVAYRLVV